MDPSFLSNFVSKLICISSFHEVTCPESKIISKQLHYSGRVPILFLLEGLQVGDGIIESVFSQFAGNVWLSLDLVVENTEVESQSQSNWVSGLQFLCLIGSDLVGVACFLNNVFTLVPCHELTQVSEIVSLHLLIEHDCLRIVRICQ